MSTRKFVARWGRVWVLRAAPLFGLAAASNPEIPLFLDDGIVDGHSPANSLLFRQYRSHPFPQLLVQEWVHTISFIIIISSHLISSIMLTSSLPSPPSPSSSSKRKVDEISKEEDAEELPLASSKVPVVVLPVVPPKDEKQPDEQQQQQQQDQDKKEDDEEVVAAAAEQAAEEVAKAVNDDDEDNEALTPSGKRRFFPRVKHLLAIEWEPVSEMELRWNGMNHSY
jgi:hypothetical protein